MQCTHRYHNGIQCLAHAGNRPSGQRLYCYQHDPEHAADRLRAAAKRGHKVAPQTKLRCEECGASVRWRKRMTKLECDGCGLLAQAVRVIQVDP